MLDEVGPNSQTDKPFKWDLDKWEEIVAGEPDPLANDLEYQALLAKLKAEVEAGGENDLPDDLPELDEPDEGDTLVQMAASLTMDGIKAKLTPEQVQAIDAWDKSFQDWLVEIANDPSRGIDFIVSRWGWIEFQEQAFGDF